MLGDETRTQNVRATRGAPRNRHHQGLRQWPRVVRGVIGALLAMCWGCTNSGTSWEQPSDANADASTDDVGVREPRVLAPLIALSPVSAADDPLRAHRPEEISCNNLTGWYAEGDMLEVDTGKCNYLALFEPAATSAPTGAIVTTTISHFDLTSVEPAVVHLALLLDETILWERNITIPADGNVLDVSAELHQPVSKGDPVHLHLHNHGQNTYNFGRLWVSEPLP